jgi:hypothetical protein
MSEGKDRKPRPGHYVDVTFPALDFPKLPPLPGLPALPRLTFDLNDITFAAPAIDDPLLTAAGEDLRRMLKEKLTVAARMRDALQAEEQQRDAAELPVILAEAERVFGSK